MLLTIDRLAQRYGRWPHEVLRMDPFELALAVSCLDQADATRRQRIEAVKEVMPVIDVGRD